MEQYCTIRVKKTVREKLEAALIARQSQTGKRMSLSEFLAELLAAGKKEKH